MERAGSFHPSRGRETLPLAGRSSTRRPASVIRVQAAGWPPARTASIVGVASPTRTRLFSISAENPRAISTASAMPFSPASASISSAPRHSGLSGTLFANLRCKKCRHSWTRSPRILVVSVEWDFGPASRPASVIRTPPSPQQAEVLRARFDRIFKRGATGYVMLDRLLRRLFRNKDALLRVLDRPEIPLNTNASESDIRAFVTKRKISGGTVSDTGRDARDIMLGLAKTCMKLKLSFYEFLGDRLGIPGAQIPPLAELIRPAPA